MELSEFDDDQLLKELERRKFIKEKGSIPIQLNNVDDKTIRSYLASIVEEIVDGRWHEDNDDEHYLYELLFTLYYGPEFWTWFNKTT